MKKQGETRKVYVHMLNGTLTATERSMCCVVENWQTPEASTLYSDHPTLTLFADKDTATHPSSRTLIDGETGPHNPASTSAVHARSGVPSLGKGTAKVVAEEGAVNLWLAFLSPSGYSVVGGAVHVNECLEA